MSSLLREGAIEVIVVEQVEFAYGNLPVLRGVDLRIRPGEVVFLLGPNGVGKTTLVELLLGFLSPDSGTIRVLGVDPGKADSGFWGRIGLVQQSWSDHTRWRVCDQLEWVRAIQATSGRSGSTVAEVLRMVGLEDKAKVRLGRLSGGQRRTIDLAAVLLGKPELLILDEPTAGLDPASRARVHDLILERVDDAATVLMTSHDLAEVERLASRVVIMGRGRVFADGTVTELREQFSGTAQVTWHEAGERHVHATSSPEGFVKTLGLDAISGLTITRPNLEDAYLALTKEGK